VTAACLCPEGMQHSASLTRAVRCNENLPARNLLTMASSWSSNVPLLELNEVARWSVHAGAAGAGGPLAALRAEPVGAGGVRRLAGAVRVAARLCDARHTPEKAPGFTALARGSSLQVGAYRCPQTLNLCLG
jgi:hypothetical protein